MWARVCILAHVCVRACYVCGHVYVNTCGGRMTTLVVILRNTVHLFQRQVLLWACILITRQGLLAIVVSQMCCVFLSSSKITAVALSLPFSTCYTYEIHILRLIRQALY